MQHFKTLLVVPFVVSLFNIEETSASNSDLFSEEAKIITKELQKYKNDLEQSFDVFANELKEQNNVLDAFKEYREMYESSKNTRCEGEELPIEDGKGLLSYYVDDCTSTLPLEKLVSLNNKIKEARAKVKAFDDSLLANAETCESNPSACEETKKKTLQEMDNVLSDKAKAKFQKDAQNVLIEAKKYVEKCFAEEAHRIVDALKQATSIVANCMSTLD